MMKQFTTFTIYLLFTLLLTSCGKSPFLSKEKKDRGPGQSTSPVRLPVGESIFAGAFKFKKTNLSFHVYWKSRPKVGLLYKMFVIFFNKDGIVQPPPHNFSMKLWMPGMGHGSLPIKVESLAPGVYRASNICFTMDGYWDLHFQLFNGKGSLTEQVKWGMTF